MDDGIIASRYADALLKYVLENGDGEAVCAQAMLLEKSLSELPDLAMILETPEEIPDDAKIGLIASAVGGKMEDGFERFVRMVFENRRVPLLKMMLRDFIIRYQRSQGKVKGHLRVVTAPPESLLEKLRSLVKAKTGLDAEIETTIDPSLIGGFVFDIDDYLIDASIVRQLDRIRAQFVDNNRRIV